MQIVFEPSPLSYSVKTVMMSEDLIQKENTHAKSGSIYLNLLEMVGNIPPETNIVPEN